jgi:BA14K-like protein
MSSVIAIAKKLTVSILAATILAGTFAASTSTASASGLSRREAVILAGTGGFILGAIAGHSGRHHRHHSRVVYVDSWDSHVARCLARYRSYDPRSDTYIGYDGYERRCRL